MDRTSECQIKKTKRRNDRVKASYSIRTMWILYVFGLALLIGITLVALIKSQGISKTQIHEMTTLYPDMEKEIHSMFHYYDGKRNLIPLCLGGLAIFIYTIVFGIILSSKKKEDRNHQRIQQLNYMALLEQIQRFLQGNYDIPLNLFLANIDPSAQIVWNQIEDKLRELGYHLQGQKEELEREENATKAMITNISHQLKTPLSALKMSNELSQELTFSSEEQVEFLQKEQLEIQKLQVLLDEMVKLSRLENHMIQLEKEQAGVKELITDAINQVFPKAYAKKMELQVEIPEDIFVQVDSKWTVEAFVNVMDNAIKYSKEQSEIQIRVKGLPNVVIIEVEDQGIGIPFEELHKIFHRFYRGKDASHYTKEGAGVGLYLTRKILEQEGGTIVAKRKQGGTIFIMTLPR